MHYIYIYIHTPIHTHTSSGSCRCPEGPSSKLGNFVDRSNNEHDHLCSGTRAKRRVLQARAPFDNKHNNNDNDNNEL